MALFVVVINHFLGLQLTDIADEGRTAEVMGTPGGHAAARIITERPPARAVDGIAAAAALRVVRPPRRGAEPHVPVDLLGHFFGWQIAQFGKRPDVDIARLDLPELARPGRIDLLAVIFEHALATARNHASVPPGGADHQRAR